MSNPAISLDPLTDDERQTAPQVNNLVSDFGELISPITLPKTGIPDYWRECYGTPATAQWVYRDSAGYPLLVQSRFDKDDKKEFKAQTLWRKPNGRLVWRWKNVEAPRPLYNLDGLAKRPNAPVIVCEGEKKAPAAESLFTDFVATSPMNGSKSPDKADWSPLAGRAVTVWPDNDKAGHDFADAVARLCRDAGAVVVRVVDVPHTFPEKWDLADKPPEGVTPEDLRSMLDGAAVADDAEPDTGPKREDNEAAPDPSKEITRLAKLKPVEYELQRKKAADALGMRAGALDQLVKAERPQDDSGMAGRALDLPDIDPWDHEVDGEALLAEIAAAIRRYVVLTDQQAALVALWCVFTHVIDRFPIAPRLAVQSAEKGSGKSTLLDVVSRLVPRPLQASGITAAAIFRVIEAEKPCLLIDEADTLFRKGGDEDLRGVLNSGHSRATARVIRVVGENHEVRAFSTWCPMALAGIGKLPDTIQDRSLIISIKRRRPDETVEPFRMDRENGTLSRLARQAARWADDHGAAIGRADPVMPPGVFNRLADNLRPILAIADEAGGEWPQKARKAVAAVLVSASDDDSVRVRLLADIRKILAERKVDRIASADLVEKLADIEGSPWAEWKAGKPITTNALARQLAHFKISPNTHKIDGRAAKGYEASDFKDAFARYLPNPTVTPLHPKETAAYGGFQTVTPEKPVTDAKTPNPAENKAGNGVTVENGGDGAASGWEADL